MPKDALCAGRAYGRSVSVVFLGCVVDGDINGRRCAGGFCACTRDMDLSHLMMLAAGYRLLPLAAENQRHRRGWSSLLAPETSVVKSTVPPLSYQGFRRLRLCGGEVIAVGVEAVSPREVVDRRVLTADVDAGPGLTTCEREGSARRPNSDPPCGVVQGDLVIPVIGSAVCEDGGGVEQKEGHGSGTSRSGR